MPEFNPGRKPTDDLIFVYNAIVMLYKQTRITMTLLDLCVKHYVDAAAETAVIPLESTDVPPDVAALVRPRGRTSASSRVDR